VRKEHIGSTLDDFLKEEGILAECEAGALARVVAWQLEEEMKRKKISRSELAQRMKTDPAVVNSLFAQNGSSISLRLLEEAALALGRKLRVELA
jgi:antitoxin HicB